MSNEAGFGLRVAETNSAINGGKQGLSEVFGAALWTADVTLEFARAGATGVHMHWVRGARARAAAAAQLCARAR